MATHENVHAVQPPKMLADMTPFPATPASFRTSRLVRREPARLYFIPNLGWARFFLAATATLWLCVVVVDALGFAWFDTQQAASILAMFCLFFALVVAERWLRVPTVRVDRNSRMIYHRRCFSRRRLPFSQVSAVQLLAGVMYAGDEGPSQRQYQINLLLNDSDTSRLNISNHPDRDWTLQSGRELARFIRAPLVDQLGNVNVLKD